MTRTEYDDVMARARAALAVLNRAAVELSSTGRDRDVDSILADLREDLCRPDAPGVAQPIRR
ncbi:MAG: hypothetical protein P4L86_08420 [Mycobacterium sp.]|nr:hypothetical protein [Mycobacterium sp.]